MWRASFFYPVPPAPRTAVFCGMFRSKGSVRVFAVGWSGEAARYAPQSIAARLEQLEELAGIARPTHALIVLRREWEPELSPEDREWLWRAFGVPAFAQIIGENGELFAAECEAHCGLHIESRRFVAGDHEVDRSACACGKTSARLVQPVRMRRTAAVG